MKKGREKEALLVLTKINKHSKKETLVDTYLELEDIKESIQNTDLVDKWVLWRDLYHLKFRWVGRGTRGWYMYEEEGGREVVKGGRVCGEEGEGSRRKGSCRGRREGERGERMK